MRGMEAPGVEPMDQSEMYTATALCTVEVPAVCSSLALVRVVGRKAGEERRVLFETFLRRDTPHFQIPDPRSHQK